MINYIDGPEVRITENDGIFVDVEFFHTKEKIEGLELHRLFPRSGSNKYIVLLNEEGEQTAIIRNIENLDPDSKAVVEKVLEEYYMIPRITKFISMTENSRYGCGQPRPTRVLSPLK